MSSREYAIDLINMLPDYKIDYVIAFLQGAVIDESRDEKFCEALVDEYEREGNKGDFVSLDEARKLCGVG